MRHNNRAEKKKWYSKNADVETKIKKHQLVYGGNSLETKQFEMIFANFLWH